MRELLVATGNSGKLQELILLLSDTVQSLKSLRDYPAMPKTVEDCDTFEGNAIKKAREAAAASGIPALADDSGLVVDSLGGEPGVRSARFAGEEATDSDNNAMLLARLIGIPPDRRTAAFRCAIALCYPDGACYTFHGEIKGLILDVPRGDKGFGYDPLFLVPEYGKTLAELPLAVKNRVSHRANALMKLKHWLQNN